MSGVEGDTSLPLGSAWLVQSEETADEIRDRLQRFADRDDGLVVICAGEGAAWLGLSAQEADWLSESFV